MKSKLTLLFALIAFSFAAVSAQFPIGIPKLPKIKKEKPQPNAPSPAPSSESNETATSSRSPEPEKAQTADVCKTNPAYRSWLDDMETTLREAEEYKPGLRDYYVRDFNDRRNDYLMAAISHNFRKEWFKEVDDPAASKCFTPVFDAIAAAAKKTLPTYHATSTYVAAAPADRKLMLGVIEGVARATIYKVALSPGTWEIGKDSYNFPVSRYKYGEVWLKWPDTDDGYCRIYYVNIVQDYAGGGRYGGSYARHVDDEPAGCPPGK